MEHGRWHPRTEDALRDDPWKSLARDDPWKSLARDDPWKSLARDDPWKSLARDDPWKSLARGDPWKSLARDDPWKSLARGDPWKSLARDDPWKSLARGDPWTTPGSTRRGKSPTGDTRRGETSALYFEVRPCAPAARRGASRKPRLRVMSTSAGRNRKPSLHVRAATPATLPLPSPPTAIRARPVCQGVCKHRGSGARFSRLRIEKNASRTISTRFSTHDARE